LGPGVPANDRLPGSQKKIIPFGGARPTFLSTPAAVGYATKKGMERSLSIPKALKFLVRFILLKTINQHIVDFTYKDKAKVLKIVSSNPFFNN